jgi:hypothetical protein
VSITATTLNIPLVITATNEAGTDVKTCAIGITANTETQGGGQGNGDQLDNGGEIIRPKNGEGGSTPVTPVKKPKPGTQEPITPVKKPN